MDRSLRRSTPVALECHELTKRFGGLEAVKGISLLVEEGERRAIIGPNGAGKTTLFGLISGLHPVTSGSIRIFGDEITHLPSHRRTHLGLGRTFQITNLFPTLTVLNNLILAQMGLRRTKFSMVKPLSMYEKLQHQALDMLEQMGMKEKARRVVRNLSYGEQRQIEIALALINHPRVLLLDEPTAGASPADVGFITQMVLGLERQMTILIIEHNMDVALQVADRVTVMHQGRVFAEGTPGEIRANPEVQQIYFGRDDESPSRDKD